MLIERSLLPNYLTNTYLVAAGEDGPGLFIDAGGPVEPLIEFAAEHRITPTHILLTHHHGDHVQELGKLRDAYPDAKVLAHPDEGIDGAEPFADGTYAGLEVKGIHTPGHTAGMLNFLVEGRELFTGDTLFKNSVGGVKAPGSTSYEDIRSSIMDKLMALPHDVTVRPGHTDPTTVGDEWEHNAFIRVWRGLDPEGDEPCTVWDREARLVLWGDDYDGGHKAWIRWADDGSDDIVPGSQVNRG
jgi:hydroxyacylglutathione hydrolase